MYYASARGADPFFKGMAVLLWVGIVVGAAVASLVWWVFS